MLLVGAPIVGIVLGLLTGGSLANWDRLRFRWPWLILIVILARAAAGFTPLSAIDGLRYVYVGSQALLVIWTLIQLRALPGVWLVTIGATLNLIVIVANGAHMPVSQISGYLPRHPGVGTYVIADSSTRLNWLGDWIGLPGWLGGAVSPGDFVIALGVGVVAFAATRFSASPTKLIETSDSMGR